MAQLLSARAVSPASLASATRVGLLKAPQAGTTAKFAPLSGRISVRASQNTTQETAKEDQTALAGSLAAAVFSALAVAPSASAAELLAEIAADDNRIFALLVPLVPALGWVIFNILKPALNQLNKMQGKAARAASLGLGASAAAAASGLLMSESADAAELVSQLAEADNRLFALLVPVVPALGWVLFNIARPALNQLAKMQGASTPTSTVKKTTKRGIVGAIGAAGLMAVADSAEAAQEFATLAEDNRPLVLLFVLAPAVGWVLFNILKPALNQLNKMQGKK